MFDEHHYAVLYTLKCNLLDYVVEDLRIYGRLSTLDSNLHKHFNLRNERATERHFRVDGHNRWKRRSNEKWLWEGRAQEKYVNENCGHSNRSMARTERSESYLGLSGISNMMGNIWQAAVVTVQENSAVNFALGSVERFIKSILKPFISYVCNLAG